MVDKIGSTNDPRALLGIEDTAPGVDWAIDWPTYRRVLAQTGDAAKATQVAGLAKQQQTTATNKATAATNRTAAVDSARTSAGNYFRDLGLDPSQYSGSIDDTINRALSSVAPDDPNVGSYLSNIGQTVYNNRRDAMRNQAEHGLNSVFQPDFESSRISSNAADPFVNAINTKQRSTADDYITNLLKRNVITNTGAQGAERNLDTQGARVRTQLNDLGNSTIASGRQSLTDIANRARSAAQTTDLGSTFDPSKYIGEADTTTNNFLSGLGDSISAKVPGNLYDTSGLAASAGAAQGGQNTKFDPFALAGISQDDNNPVPSTRKPRTVF